MFSNEIICNIIEFLDKNINNKINIDDIVKEFYYSRFYIMKLFKKEIGCSIIDYINYTRIFNSIGDLKNNNSMLYIALKNGFNSEEYYSEIFKKILRINPKKFKLFLNKSSKISFEKYNEINRQYIFLMEFYEGKKLYISNRKPAIVPKLELSLHQKKISL